MRFRILWASADITLAWSLRNSKSPYTLIQKDALARFRPSGTRFTLRYACVHQVPRPPHAFCLRGYTDFLLVLNNGRSLPQV